MSSRSPKRRPYTPRLPPQERREQLLDAALRIIGRDGYAGVSIDAIAREAGVTRPVVYGVFDGLQALLDAEYAAHALIAVAEYFGRMIVTSPETFDGERLTRAVASLVASLRI